MSCAVGICAAIEHGRWGVWEADVTLATRAYVTAVQDADAVALILPPDDAVAKDPDVLLDRVDALMLAGGNDVDPTSYGERPHPETGPTWPERDRFELALTHRALERQMPVLGICRGMQMLNVALGGTLHQHLPEIVGHTDHRHTPGAFGDHDVRLEPGSLAARAAGGERITVKSHHHQALNQLGEGLEATGWAVDDDVVEAVELEAHPFALGVLWHPEEDVRSRVIGSLVSAARAEVPAS